MTNSSTEQVRSALAFISPQDRDVWIKIGMAIKSELGDGGFSAWDDWSKQADSYDSAAARDSWRSFDDGGNITVGTLFLMAQEGGWKDDPANQNSEKEALPWKNGTNSDLGRKFYNAYFATRGIFFNGQTPPCIKWNEYTDRKTRTTSRMVVFAVTTLADQKVYAVQRIFCEVAEGTIVKKTGAKMLGACGGRAVYFDRKMNFTEFTVAEGCETALSIRQAFLQDNVPKMNCVASLSTSFMPSLPFPEGSMILNIAVDSDQMTQGMPGQRAAYALAKRFEDSKEGRIAYLVTPDETCFTLEPVKLDFNDLLQKDHSGESIRQRFSGRKRFFDLNLRPEVKKMMVAADSSTSDESAPKPKADAWDDPIPFPEKPSISCAPYPLECLPSAIRSAAEEVARFSKVPSVSPAVVGLSCCAVSIGKRAVVIERPGLRHHPAIFHALIAESGERKSPPFKTMTSPIDAWTQQQNDLQKMVLIEVAAKNSVIDAALAGMMSLAKKQGADLDSIGIQMADLESQKKAKPAPAECYTTDTTEQRLFQLMEEKGGEYAVLSGEGRPVIDAIMGKYSGAGRTGEAIFLAGISGDTITRDRVGSADSGGPERSRIYDPCLNVCIMIQPDKYLEAAQCRPLRSSGALARIWPVWMPSLVGTRFEEAEEGGMDQAALNPYRNLIDELRAAHPPADEDTGQPGCHEAHMSEGAAEARRIFHNQVERLMGTGNELDDVRDIACKAVTQTVKLALVIHLAETPSLLAQKQSFISMQTWAKAQLVGTYHLEEAIRIQRFADESYSPTMTAARRTLDWLANEKRPTITSLELSQSGPRPRPSAKEAAAIMELLEDHGYAMGAIPPGKRKPVFTLHPDLTGRGTSQSSQSSRGGGGK